MNGMISALKDRLRPWITRLFPGRYWRLRTRKYGKRAVLNLVHPEAEYDEVTRQQKSILFPALQSQLNGRERRLLDFGCGPGRFTKDLAELIHGVAVGADVVPELLALAPKTKDVEYCLVGDLWRSSPLPQFDVVWCCLVLGGIPDAQIRKTVHNFQRVLHPGGLLFLVENTTVQQNVPHWTYRTAGQYRDLFPEIPLTPQVSYSDLGEEITVLAGRKKG